ncbi:AI-2E family transporter [Pradoshia sp.]
MNIQVKWFYRLGFFLLLFIVLFVFYLLRPIWMPILHIILTALSPFLFGAFISYLLHPLVGYIESRGLNRGLAIGLLYLVVFGLTGFGVYKGVPILVEQLNDIAVRAPEMAELYRTYILKFHTHTRGWPFGLHERLEAIINTFELRMGESVNVLVEALSGLSDVLILIILIPVISFYLLKDSESLIEKGLLLIPERKREQTRRFLTDVDRSLGGYIRGQLLVCLIIGASVSVLFYVFGMNYPLLLGFIIGVTNIIPYFGPVIGAIPSILVALTISGGMAVKVVCIILVLQFLEGNVISPIVMGKTLRLHPLIIIFVLLVGGKAAGVAGLILAVPILALVKVMLAHRKLLMNKE